MLALDPILEWGNTHYFFENSAKICRIVVTALARRLAYRDAGGKERFRLFDLFGLQVADRRNSELLLENMREIKLVYVEQVAHVFDVGYRHKVLVEVPFRLVKLLVAYEQHAFVRDGEAERIDEQQSKKIAFYKFTAQLRVGVFLIERLEIRLDDLEIAPIRVDDEEGVVDDRILFVPEHDGAFKPDVKHRTVGRVEQIFRMFDAVTANDEIARLYGILVALRLESPAPVRNKDKLRVRVGVRGFVCAAATDVLQSRALFDDVFVRRRSVHVR